MKRLVSQNIINKHTTASSLKGRWKDEHSRKDPDVSYEDYMGFRLDRDKNNHPSATKYINQNVKYNSVMDDDDDYDKETTASSLKGRWKDEHSRKDPDVSYEDYMGFRLDRDKNNHPSATKYINQNVKYNSVMDDDDNDDDKETTASSNRRNKKINAKHRGRGGDSLQSLSKQFVDSEYNHDITNQLLEEDYNADIEPNVGDTLKEEEKEAARNSILNQKYNAETDTKANPFYEAAITPSVKEYPHIDDDMPKGTQTRYVTDRKRQFQNNLAQENNFWITAEDVEALLDKITDPQFIEDLKTYEDKYLTEGLDKEEWDELYEQGILDTPWDKVLYSYQELQDEHDQYHDARNGEAWSQKHMKDVADGIGSRRNRLNRDKDKHRTDYEDKNW